jgi:hypothetical protein
MLTKLEELKSCQKELDASKEISKKLMMERNMLEQKIQRLERAKAEEVFFFVNHQPFPFPCSEFLIFREFFTAIFLKTRFL